MMKMEMKLFSLWLCVLGTTGVQQNFPYQTYSPQPYSQLNKFSYDWSGVQTPPQAGFQHVRSLETQPISFQNNGQTYSKFQQAEPLAYQIITITDYSSNGSQGSQLSSKLSNPVDIFKLFQTPYETHKPYDFPSLYGGQKSAPKKVVTFGTKYDLSPKLTPPKVIPFNYQDSYNPSTVQRMAIPNYSNQYGSISSSGSGIGSRSGIGGSRSNIFHVKNWTRSFDFPSSEDLDAIWGNTLDGVGAEKTVDVRAVTPAVRQTKKFVQAALDAHNGYRKKHKVSSLAYNGQIAKVAQAWANKLIGSLAQGGRLQHRPNNKYGENLWMGSGYKFSDEEAVKFAVKSWYDEIGIYKPYFGREPSMSNFAAWGHFTQVVWKSTARLGMGIARKNNIIVVVANYDPPGNYKGQYVKNVKKP